MRNNLLFSVAFGLAFAFPVHTSLGKSYLLNLDATPLIMNEGVQNTVQGTVSDASGPLAGVTVSVVGGTAVVATDSNGRFSINAPVGSTLRFSFIGYQSKDLPAAANMTVVLDEDESTLEQVVVVGYGTQKREHLTGAVSSVDADKVFGTRPIADAARGLQGVVPGLNIVVPSGEVGSDAILRIRGQVGSQVGGSNPLILVDNVEVPSLQYVNPADIETISVLKDAASASIYGAKAAFGVVLITTKQGATGAKPSINYTNNFIWQSPVQDINIAGVDGLQYSLDAHRNMKQAGPAGGFWRIDEASMEKIREWQELYGNTVKNDDPVLYGRDWWWDGTQKFGYRVYDAAAAMVRDNAFSQKHNLSVNGSSGDTRYNIGIGYLGENGMMKPAKHDDHRRFNPSLSLSTKINDFLSVRGRFTYSEGTKRNPASLNAAGFAADPWLYLYRWSRLFPIGVQENGKDIIDPAFSARESNDAILNKKYLSASLGTVIDITNNWDIQADYAYVTENISNFSSVPYVQGKTHWYGVELLRDADGNQVFVDEQGNVVESGGMPAYQFPMTDHTTRDASYVSQSTFFERKHTFNAYSTYQLNVDDAHDFKFMLGANVVALDNRSHYSQRGNLMNADNPQFNFATGTETSGGGNYWESQAGFFGRFNYALQNKYLFEANLRYDGTSKFPRHLRWQWYPSFSGGWVISNESFMEPLTEILSFAKLRASWGSIGDQDVSNSLYIPTMNILKNSWLNSAGEQFFYMSTPSPVTGNMDWQRIEHLNIGADFRFFNNKLGLTGEWYKRNTLDMIIGGTAMPDTYGQSVAPLGNYGNLSTKGWEIAADYSHQFENGLRLTVNANIADAVTHITKAADWNIPWENRSIGSTFSTGRRYGDVYGFVTDRLFQKEDFVYDADGNFVQTTIIRDGVAKRTNVLAGDNPVYQTYFEDGNQVLLISPGDVKFVDLNGDGYIDAGNGTNGDMGDRTVIGNITPRYEYGFRLGADFKGFDFAVFLQGIGKRSIWGSGQLAIPGYFSKEGAMPQAIAGDYWTENNTDAFYPRAWNLNGADEGFVMRRQSRYMLDMSYLRVKNITLGYSLPNSLLSRAKISTARLFVSLENMFTFDNLNGLPIDPEAISGESMLRPGGGYNLGRTGTSNPVFRSASMGLQFGF